MPKPRFHFVLLAFLAFAIPTVRAANRGPLLAPEQQLLARMAADGTNAATLYALGDICHDAGVEGDKKAVSRAEEYLRLLLELEPTNAPALALLGSVYTLKGRDAFWPMTQLRLVREGNEYMDKAARMAPDNIEVRLTRALNNTHMPDFLGRTEIARTDLAWLWEKIEKEPALFSTSAKQQVALHLGKQWKRQRQADEARRVWHAGIAFAPDSTDAREMSRELADLH